MMVKFKALSLIACVLLGLSSMQAVAADTRVFENRFGRVEVPVAPRCVVSLHDLSLTTQLLELGITPCGSTGRKKLFSDVLFRGAQQRFDVSGIRYVGSHQSPDLEAIAALKPDLIVGLSYHQDLKERLSSIAPVVLLPAREADIKTYAKELAELVGKQQRYQKLLNEYQWIVGEFAKRVKEPGRITVTTLEVYPDGFQLIGRSGMDDVIADFGLGRVSAFKEARQNVPYSLERIGDFDSDFIIDTYEEMLGSEAGTEAFRRSPQWQNLFAVKNHQFLYFNRSRFADTMQGMIGSAYLLLSHIGERDYNLQEK
ncbi:iron complex transport system substrate-binding protein [Pseudomonas sp. SJZ103]|uniref:ABC transporter substrate-binding protein n=1 Tax=unclassified Pseudomonas TaxID=196821 RepID=UPI0011ADE05E|nr:MULTISPECIES: ABC transporter substrate-binding protein [unclassified Pseudomonas]MBB6288131.1 iron complex transport system substrate-binding protein [Pseudomonas sp. SJZ073]MBB6313103.1 iron complex transport system substrate-binding protein [Pseudomonas sp. JAI120]MCS4310430.1 iron complex transport system substrate-binding protein [Pseudomonas sp. BIGb0381]TWC75020.1 iron complex transport system substrate-binding protein [Pseudomonas sp. SJZ103]TWC92851.1 iron complex transport system 